MTSVIQLCEYSQAEKKNTNSLHTILASLSDSASLVNK